MPNWIAAFTCILLLATAGCRTLPNHLATPGRQIAMDHSHNRELVEPVEPIAPLLEPEIDQVVFETNEEDQTTSSRRQLLSPENASFVQGSMTLAELEQHALSVNPAIRQSEAEIESLRGKLKQAGLGPNPVAGIVGDDINENGGSGRYGIFLGQEIVRGNKLGLSRSVVRSEIDAANQRLSTIRQKLLTDVRQHYYELLVAQEKAAVAAELVAASQKSVDASIALFEAAEAARTSVLQSELELENAKVTQRQAENEVLAARRKLATFLGESDLPATSVSGDLRDIYELEEFEQSFDTLVSSSPEIAELFAEVDRARRQLARECVEAVPNLTWQTSFLYDTVGNDVVAGFQVGMPIPTTDRNQGAIYQARQSVTAAQQNAEKGALGLRKRLAAAYETYLDAKLQVDAYSSEILPKANESFELISQGYAEGEIDFLIMLTAQRTYSQTKLIYLESLRRLWQQNVRIRGMLLSGSID